MSQCEGKLETVKCESKNYKKAQCEVKDGEIKAVTVEEQLSNAKCEEKKTWAYDKSNIYVDGGCRAKFSVCVKGMEH